MVKFAYFMKSFLGMTVFSAVMFAAAGTLRYDRGWLLYAVSMFGLAVNFVPIMRNEELMIERSAAGKDAKAWDKKIMGVYALLSLVSYMTAGFDSGRFHWSPSPGVAITSVGMALIIAGQMMFMAARIRNAFFSSVARIQKERNHTVCDAGIYRIVRHPGYLGMMISLLGFPAVAGSVFSCIPIAMAVGVLIARTALEDRMLREELTGYAEYSSMTRYRLIPYIW